MDGTTPTIPDAQPLTDDTATVRIFMTAGHSRHQEVDTDSERFLIARDLRTFGTDAFAEFDHDPERAAAVAYDELGEPATLTTAPFDMVRELLEHVYGQCQGGNLSKELGYDGARTRSMTVGDVIVVNGDAWLVARVGFERMPALDRLDEDDRDEDDQNDEPTVATDGGLVAQGPPVGRSLDVRTHYAHVRYAATEEAGVIWYDPRDGHERFVRDIDVTPASLAADERRLTSVDLYMKYGRCQQADPAAEWVVEYTVTSRGEYETRDGETVGRLDQVVRTETYADRRAAQMAVAEEVPAYADAEYRNAVAARVDAVGD